MPRIEALVLAAGLSSRMQTNKMLLKLSGKTVIRHSLERVLASKVNSVTLVVGCRKEQLEQELKHYDLKIIENAAFARGMGTSIREGIRYLLHQPDEIDAVLICLGDMPLIKPGTIDRLLQVYSDTGCLIAAPFYQGRRGHPVLFDKKLFSKLAELSGDTGAKEILKECCAGICRVEVDDPGVLMDIDNWEDYLKIKQYTGCH
ncbi:nucleotidyltransferase family protein [Desulfallas sp. Bu1-1]|uniref:nucleotidyltransferase family protein n=1 Tax=Desulfallas sp. Bu1-1 TaxID=2787620 RepID=UPI00189E248A|nr:nucleotidyltransferase family protein [Desulfallas sp. Bu1-1]MBF7084715.1 nucleotidyltransferase family protein [Desulfallas sp. Bu1-1]